MARLNIEDEFWSDQRFLRLCVALGDELRAVGAVVMGWKLAQVYWCPEKAPIPSAKFIDSGLPEALITVGLAVRIENGIRMKGSERHFSWWFEKRRAGLASAKVRRNQTKPNESTDETPVEQVFNDVEQRSTDVDIRQPLTPPLTPTPPPPQPPPQKSSSKKRKPPSASPPEFFPECLAKFKEVTNVGTKGSGAERRFSMQVKCVEDSRELIQAIENYGLMLKKEDWRSKKQTFLTFLGSNDEPFWRRWIDWKPEPTYKKPKFEDYSV